MGLVTTIVRRIPVGHVAGMLVEVDLPSRLDLAPFEVLPHGSFTRCVMLRVGVCDGGGDTEFDGLFPQGFLVERVVWFGDQRVV